MVNDSRHVTQSAAQHLFVISRLGNIHCPSWPPWVYLGMTLRKDIQRCAHVQPTSKLEKENVLDFLVNRMVPSIFLDGAGWPEVGVADSWTLVVDIFSAGGSGIYCQIPSFYMVAESRGCKMVLVKRTRPRGSTSVTRLFIGFFRLESYRGIHLLCNTTNAKQLV